MGADQLSATYGHGFDFFRGMGYGLGNGPNPDSLEAPLLVHIQRRSRRGVGADAAERAADAAGCLARPNIAKVQKAWRFRWGKQVLAGRDACFPKRRPSTQVVPRHW